MRSNCKSFIWIVVVLNLINCICGNIVVITSNNNRKFLSSSTTTTSPSTPVSNIPENEPAKESTTLGKVNDLPDSSSNSINPKGKEIVFISAVINGN